MEENTTHTPVTQAEAPDTREMLTAEQAAEFLGMKLSYIRKLTHLKQLPHYKPFGKRVYYKRSELSALLQRNRIATDEELDIEAARIMSRRARI